MAKQWDDLVLDGLAALKKRDNWTLGDIALKVVQSFGEDTLDEYADELRIDKTRIRQYRRTSEVFPPHERRHELLWSHYYALKGRHDRHEWLQRCIDEKIAVSSLEEMLRQEREGRKPRLPMSHPEPNYMAFQWIKQAFGAKQAEEHSRTLEGILDLMQMASYSVQFRDALKGLTDFLEANKTVVFLGSEKKRVLDVHLDSARKAIDEFNEEWGND